MRRSPSFLLCMLLLSLLAACSGPKPGTVVNNNITVTVNEPALTVNVFGTMQFSATVTGTSNTAVTWQVNSVTGGSLATGFISSTGLFFAPGNAPTDQSANPLPVTITAVSKASSSAFGTAQLKILAAQNQAAQAGAVMLGTSGGSVKDVVVGVACCGGTLGSLVTRGGTQFILSNNHVLAKSDSGTAGGPPNGDQISQPSIIDVPTTCSTTGTKTVANLTEFYNMETGPLPKVDAAIAQVVSGQVASNILFLGSTQTNGVPNAGAPVSGSGILPATAVGAPHNGLVAKVGRTTALTCSTIIGTNVASSITYTANCDGTGNKFTVNYTNLVDITGQFGAEGDSGSLIVTQDTAEAVALLVGGNTTDTVGNAIGDVLSSFPGGAATLVGGAAHQVIGCTLPTKPANAVKVLSVSSLSAEALEKATSVRDAHGPELMAHPEVQAVGVGASYDNPAEATILFFVTRGMPRTNLPQQVDGVRTRVIEGDLFASRGVLSSADSAALERSAPAPQIMNAVSQAEYTRVKTVQAAHLAALQKLQGVQAVGISSSVDSPGEGTLLIYFLGGVEHAAIPVVIDGVRTRVREGDKFLANFGEAHPRRGCAVPPAKTAAKTAASDQSPRP
jgi:hypothetical protein